MKIKHLLLGAFLLGASFTGNAQLLLNEQFNYGDTIDELSKANIGGAEWKRHSGSGTPIQYDTNSLNYLNYPDNLVGGSVSLSHGTGSREDVNKALPSPLSSGSVYVSLLMNVASSGGSTGDYCFHLCDSAGNTLSGNFKGRLFFKDGSTPNTFKLGLSKGGAAGVAAFTSSDYNLNQTYVVVLKYVFNTSSSNDDSVYVTIGASGIPPTEPPIYELINTDAASDLPGIKSVCLRQGSVGTGSAAFDGIRVASSWSDLTGSVSNTPSPLSAFAFNSTTQTSASLTWNVPVDYNNATQSVMVFLKQGNSITQGTPDAHPTIYTADTNFSSNGTAYQHDASAKCIFNGDGEQVNISGLNPNTPYYALAYVIRDADSVYSASVTASTTTTAPDSLNPFDLISPADHDSIVVTNTNLSDSVYLYWQLCYHSNGTDLAEYLFELDSAGGDFSDPFIQIPTSVSNVLPFTKADVYDVMVMNGLPYGQFFAATWRVQAGLDGLQRYSASTRTLYLVNRVTTGLKEQDLSARIQLYPNPSHEAAVLSGLSVSDNVIVTDITGKTVYTVTATRTEVNIPTLGFPAGVYFVKVQSGDAGSVKKLIVR